jgi:hypothetical protein
MGTSLQSEKLGILGTVSTSRQFRLIAATVVRNRAWSG